MRFTMSYAIAAACGRVISAGSSHTLCITYEGGVAAFGSGKQCGKDLGPSPSTSKSRVKTPQLLESIVFPMNPVQVSGGARHSAVLVENSENLHRQVWTFGDGGQGRLGHGPDEELSEEEGVPTCRDEPVPRPVGVLDGQRITHVVCGGAHTMAMHDNGTVFSWGKGANGRLGHGHEEDALIPTLVKSLEACGRVIQISAGGAMSAACNADGTGFTWGYGAHGRLGHGDTEDRLEPKAMQMTESELLYAAMLVTGEEHGGFIDSAGHCYSFGNGADGKLGHGNLQDQHMPKRVEFFDTILPILITNFCAGSRHSVFMTDEGDIYTCGYGGNGRLGHGNVGDQRIPKMVDALDPPEFNIVGVAAGESHTSLIVQTGQCFSFGWGQYGQLGCDSFKDKLLPEAAIDLSARCPR